MVNEEDSDRHCFICLHFANFSTTTTTKTYACPLQVSVLYCRQVGSSDKVMARCVKSQWPISLWSITYQPQSEWYSNNIIAKTKRHLRMMIKLQVGISVHASHDQLSIKRNQCMTIVEFISLYMFISSPWTRLHVVGMLRFMSATFPISCTFRQWLSESGEWRRPCKPWKSHQPEPTKHKSSNYK